MFTFLKMLVCVAGLTEIELPVLPGGHENEYRDALIVEFGGESVRVPFGRSDVVTADFLIEVDRVGSFDAALGQVIRYRYSIPGKQGVIALIVTEAVRPGKLCHLEKAAESVGVVVWLLYPKKLAGGGKP